MSGVSHSIDRFGVVFDEGSLVADAGLLAAAALLGFGPAAPSTVGTFLRSFTWGHARQLDKAAGEVLGRAWAAGGGPGAAPMTIDVDSTVCEASGKAKQGAAYGHTEQLGYHPLVAVRASTGEVLHTRLRGGSSQRTLGRRLPERPHCHPRPAPTRPNGPAAPTERTRIDPPRPETAAGARNAPQPPTLHPHRTETVDPGSEALVQ